MKLGDILSSKNQSGLVPSVTRDVEFKVLGKAKGSGDPVTATAKATLCVISEEERAEALKEASLAVARRYKDAPPSEEALGFERALQVLSLALRDSDDPRGSFAGVDELRRALVKPVAMRLYSEYLAYEAEEFPDSIDDATFKRLLEDAKKKSAVDLLFIYGSSLIQRVLPTLAVASGAPREPSTSDIGSA